MKITQSGYELELDDSGRITLSCIDAMTGRRDFISMDLSTEDFVALGTKLAGLLMKKKVQHE